MISVYRLKPGFQKLLRPTSDFLYRSGITANQVTVASIFLSASLGLMFLYYQTTPIVLLLIPMGLLFRMALNAIDGMIARQYKMQSTMGEILNEVGDFFSDLFIIFPLVIIPNMDVRVIILFAVLAIFNEFSGLLGKALGGDRRYEGPMGKSDRALLIGLFCLIYYYWEGIEIYGSWIFGIGCGLLLLSSFTRLKKSLEQVS